MNVGLRGTEPRQEEETGMFDVLVSVLVSGGLLGSLVWNMVWSDHEAEF
jgi:hypothetical protein